MGRLVELGRRYIEVAEGFAKAGLSVSQVEGYLSRGR